MASSRRRLQQRSAVTQSTTPLTISAQDAAAKSNVDPLTGFFHALGALFNNQTPTLNPHQTGETSAGVVSGNLGAVDPDSPTLTYTVTHQPTHGTVTINTDGSYSYTPTPSYAHTGTTDSFTVTVSDAASGFAIHGLPGLLHLLTFGLIGSSGATSTRSVNVTVTPFNHPPALTLTPTPNADGTTTVTLTTADVDGDTVSTGATLANGHGTLTPTPGGYTFTPDPVYAHTLSAGGSTVPGSDTVTITASDGHGGTTTSSTTVAIRPTNAAPAITVTQVSAPAADGAVISQSVSCLARFGRSTCWSARSSRAVVPSEAPSRRQSFAAGRRYPAPSCRASRNSRRRQPLQGPESTRRPPVEYAYTDATKLLADLRPTGHFHATPVITTPVTTYAFGLSRSSRRLRESVSVLK